MNILNCPKRISPAAIPGDSNESRRIEETIKSVEARQRKKELIWVLESYPDINEFKLRVEYLRNLLVKRLTYFSEKEINILKQIFENNEQIGEVYLLCLAELLEPLIENIYYYKDLELFVRILLKSSKDVLRYAALEIIASGSGINSIADNLLKEAKILLKDERAEYIRNYCEFLSFLYELKDEDQEDGVTPSEYAFSESIKLSRELGKKLKKSFPYGFSSLESRGGINLIWKNRKFDKEVRVKLPFNETLEKSVYYRHGDSSELIKNFSSEKIDSILVWLSTDKSINNF